MKSGPIRFKCLLACAAILITTTGALSLSDIASKAEEYMQAATKLDRFSGAVLIATNGRTLFSGGYNLADREWNIPNARDTKFRIGSMTKQFTSLAVMMLQERGKLDIHDPICKYVSDCPGAWQPITIHHLLSHTSGIPDYVDFPDFHKTQTQPATGQELIDRFKDKPLLFKPGEKYEYSNSGYIVLGFIVEKTSGKTYAQFLQENIFAPLGMKDSGYDSNTAIIPHRAMGYVQHGKSYENADYIDMTVPFAAGGLYSTVEDLLRWDQALYSEKLVSRKSLDAMFTPYKEIVGYGWAISSLFNRTMIHHNGGIDGFRSNIARFPSEKLLVVVLGNSEAVNADAITRDLAAIALGEKYELPHAQRAIELPPAVLDAYVGEYQITTDITLTLTRDGDRLHGQISGPDPLSFEVFPEDEAHFFSAAPELQFVFAKDEAGKVTQVLVNGEYTAKKIK